MMNIDLGELRGALVWWHSSSPNDLSRFVGRVVGGMLQTEAYSVSGQPVLHLLVQVQGRAEGDGEDWWRDPAPDRHGPELIALPLSRAHLIKEV